MARTGLEQRVALLESQIVELRNELRSGPGGRNKDWRRTIGAFTNDEGMKEILREAMRLREQDRKKVRNRRSAKRKSSA